MKKILLCFLISYCSYAQITINAIYHPEYNGVAVLKPISIKVNESIKVNYSHFPSYKDSWFWFIIMPYQEKYSNSNLTAGGGRIDYSGYVNGNGIWSTSISNEGKYKLLAVDGSLINGFTDLWLICTITITKKPLLLNDILEPQQSITIFPNPTDGSFKIATAEAITEIQIHDQMGRCILKTVSNSVDITSQSNGIYFAAIQNSNGAIWKQKIIKK